MRWGGYTLGGMQVLARFFGVKAFHRLLSIAMLGLLLGASVKWHG